LLKKNDELLKEQDFTPQVSVSEVNFFLHENDTRLSVSVNDDGTFSAGEHSFTQDEFVQILEEHPERFSPNVLLRPVTQDSMFPNTAYVAGPGEIAYAHQMKELYELFDIPQAQSLPRHSATFLEKKFLPLIDADAILSFPQLLQRYEDIEKIIVDSVEHEAFQKNIQQAQESLHAIFAELSTEIQAIDQTLQATVERGEKQALQQIDMIHGKARKALKNQQSVLLGKIKKLHGLVYPQHHLQERALAWTFFWNKYGKEVLLEQLEAVVQEDAEQHYIREV
jgi:uncharacterized protein YllA (UPF0747 family)